MKRKQRYTTPANRMLQEENERVVAERDATQLQNRRLTVLCSSLLELQGGKVEISKKLIEGFETKLLGINWEAPMDYTLENSPTLIFSYKAMTPEEFQAMNQPEITLTPVTPELGTTGDLEGEPVAKAPENAIAPNKEELAAKYIAESGKSVHASDCATSISPAETPGSCDCAVVQSYLDEGNMPHFQG